MKLFQDEGQFFRDKINAISREKNLVQSIYKFLNKEYKRTKTLLTQEGYKTFDKLYKVTDIKEHKHGECEKHVEIFTSSNYTLHLYTSNNEILLLQY